MAWAHRGDQSARVKSVASRKTGVGGRGFGEFSAKPL